MHSHLWWKTPDGIARAEVRQQQKVPMRLHCGASNRMMWQQALLHSTAVVEVGIRIAWPLRGSALVAELWMIPLTSAEGVTLVNFGAELFCF